jgi:Cytosol aminopeptidase family, catalytic domain
MAKHRIWLARYVPDQPRRFLRDAQEVLLQLMETAANDMTPTIFAERAVSEFRGIANTVVQVHDQKWAEDKKMGSFLSVTRGSDQPPKFVEIRYTGGKEGDKPIALVGKGEAVSEIQHDVMTKTESDSGSKASASIPEALALNLLVVWN